MKLEVIWFLVALILFTIGAIWFWPNGSPHRDRLLYAGLAFVALGLLWPLL